MQAADLVGDAPHGLGGLFDIALGPVLFDGQTVQDGGGDLFLIAQGLDRFFGLEGCCSGKGGGAGSQLNIAATGLALGLGLDQGVARLGPAGIEYCALQGADLGR